VWGVATSAYQVEGAVGEDGRGPSIWDTFCRVPGTIRHGDSGDVACDQYHRYAEDIELMADLGVGAYRFSVAWPRIQPEGRGAPNQPGLDHYRRLVDSLNARGITPMATLYHWDLPQALEDEGGWGNRDTALRFTEYAAIVHRSLAGTVPSWITLNEPWVAAWLGYGTGIHAPGRTDDGLALAASHHLLLAHGLARDAMGPAADVGIALNLQPARPATEDPGDVGAARLADLHMNRLFLDPLFGRGYPAELVEHYRPVSDMRFVHDGDLEIIAGPLGFLGVNYYRGHTVTAEARSQPDADELPGSLGAWSFPPPGVELTAMGWPVEPRALANLLIELHRDYGPARIVVTENGAAFDDELAPDGVVHDARRIAYLRDHIAAARAALEAGVPLAGFVVWSLLDNFEWAEGYSRRFGLVHVDFASQARTPKASAAWYAEVIRRRGVPAGLG
jgi:beta-glucosidase